MKKMVKVVSLACASAMLVSTTAFADGDAFKVGGIGPVTGGAAVYGQAVKNATELAVNEINALGGVQFEFQFEDDEHDAEKSVNAYNSLKDWGMQMLLGTVTSAPCIAVAAETANDNMFQLTPSGSAVECVQNPNAFRVCFSDPNQGTASAQYIGENKIATKIGVIYDSSDVYSSGIYENFAAEAKNQGFEISTAQTFTSDAKSEFSVQVKACIDSGADLIFLPIYYQEASLIIKEASDEGAKVTFFGCDGLDGLLSVDGFDKKLAEGVMFFTPFSADSTEERTAAFVKNYKEKYNDTPNQFAADAYDAIYIIKAAIEKADVKPSQSVSEIGDALEKAITEITYEGITGKGMTWSESGEVNKDPMVVVIKNGVYVSAE